MGKPGKLSASRFAFGGAAEQSDNAPTPTPRVASGGTGKLTWSQRQEAAKKEREAEEAASAKAISSTISTPSVVSAPVVEADEPIPPPPPAPVSRTIASHEVGRAIYIDISFSDQKSAQFFPFSFRSLQPAPPAPEPTIEETTSSLATTHLDEAPASSSGAGQKAIAIYGYDAAEDNELTFAEGDTITQVQQIDEGWWSGVGPNGVEGLFPATYVELVEGGEEEEQQSAPQEIPPPPVPVEEPEVQEDGPPVSNSEMES